MRAPSLPVTDVAVHTPVTVPPTVTITDYTPRMHAEQHETAAAA
jgi:hypothetical protein